MSKQSGTVTLSINKKNKHLLEIVVGGTSKTYPIKDESQKKAIISLLKLGVTTQVEVEGNIHHPLELNIWVENKLIYGKKFANMGNSRREATDNTPVQRNATAPYNFIPLPDKPVFKTELVPQDIFIDEHYSGYIDYELENLTTLYTRSHSDKAEFYSPNGVLQIPGSTMRGMVRNLFEILTKGKFTQFNNKRMFYRSIMRSTDFGRTYRNDFVRNIQPRTFQYNTKAAWLLKMGNSYQFHKPVNAGTYINDYIQVCNRGANQNTAVPDTQRANIEKKVYINLDNVTSQNFNHNQINLRASRLNSPTEVYSEPDQGLTEATLVRTGPAVRKHFDNLFLAHSQDLYEVAEDVFDIYKSDETRGSDDLLEKAEQGKPVPCFVILDSQNKVKAFGNTPMFRMPYPHDIKDFVPSEFQDSDEDWSESLFGSDLNVNRTDDIHSGRVCFESAKHSDGIDSLKAQMEEKTLKILSGPKANSFQLYLEQPSNVTKDSMVSWESNPSDNKIRGYKQYWHQHDSNWQATNNDTTESTQHAAPIKPVKKGQIFAGRVWFNNLCKAELGALVLALSPGEGLSQKLGLGKPLGLGSVKVSIKALHAQDKEQLKNNYKLDLNLDWHKQAKQFTEENLTEFLNAFAVEIYGQSDSANLKSRQEFWDIYSQNQAHLKQLRRMLDWDQKPQPDKIKYLEIEGKNSNLLKDRSVLPDPHTIQ